MSQPAFDFGDDAVDDPSNPTYTVGELAEAINASLRRGFHDGVWVRGEITGWNDRGNHAYFSLADDDDDGRRAVVNVQFFANARMRLRPMLRKHRLALADGMKVRIFGYLDYYAPTGRLGLKMSGIDPRYTLGEIAQSRDEVLRRLVADGLLDANHRHALPLAPLRVGVVTSVGTAAWHDFHDELTASGLGFELHVCDTRVQGDLAIEQVAAAIHTVSRRGVDAVVVIRGGGARNELAVFDGEPIARAIAVSPVPVLTGLGHEVDRSVADEVAHTSLKTPTACAGSLIARVRDFERSIDERWAAITRRVDTAFAEADGTLFDVARRVGDHTRSAIDRADERLRTRVQMITTRTPSTLDAATARLDAAAVRLGRRPDELLAMASSHLDLIDARRAAVDPNVQLARGWSITRRADGAVVRSTGDVAEGDELTTNLIDGTVTSTVTRSAAITHTDTAAQPERPNGATS